MGKLFKSPKAPVYTPIASTPTPEEVDPNARLNEEKKQKRRYAQSGRAGTVLSGGIGIG